MTIVEASKTIARSAAHFFFGTFISRASGFLREVFMAFVFGTTPEVAIFWMAYRFAFLFRRILGEGALNVAFVPHFESLKKEDPQKGAFFFYRLFMSLALFLLCLVLISEGVLGGILLWGHLETSTIHFLRLLMILLPALIGISLYALNTSFLSCEGIFFLPNVAPTLVNLFWIGSIFYFASLPSAVALEKLAMVLVLAFGIQWFVTVPPSLKFLNSSLKSSSSVKPKFDSRELLSLLKPFIFAVIGVIATQLNGLCDSLFAVFAESSGPAILWYAIRLQQLPLALLGIGITGALLPPLTRAIQKKDHEQAYSYYLYALRKMSALLLPITIGFLVMGFALITFVYGRGAFGEMSIIQTTHALWAYVLGLLPMSLVLLLAALFYAQKNYKIPMMASLASVGLNIILNAVFVFLFNWGVTSIALATSFSACFNVFILGYMLKKQLGFTMISLRSFKNIVLVTFLAGAGTLIVGYAFFSDNTIREIMGISLLPFAKTLFSQTKILAGEAFVFVAVLWVFARWFNVEEVLEVFPSFLRKFRAKKT